MANNRWEARNPGSRTLYHQWLSSGMRRVVRDTVFLENEQEPAMASWIYGTKATLQVRRASNASNRHTDSCLQSPNCLSLGSCQSPWSTLGLMQSIRAKVILRTTFPFRQMKTDKPYGAISSAKRTNAVSMSRTRAELEQIGVCPFVGSYLHGGGCAVEVLPVVSRRTWCLDVG